MNSDELDIIQGFSNRDDLKSRQIEYSRESAKNERRRNGSGRDSR
jgi:hypothetical protein